jgi:hypothetical protein
MGNKRHRNKPRTPISAKAAPVHNGQREQQLLVVAEGTRRIQAVCIYWAEELQKAFDHFEKEEDTVTALCRLQNARTIRAMGDVLCESLRFYEATIPFEIHAKAGIVKETTTTPGGRFEIQKGQHTEVLHLCIPHPHLTQEEQETPIAEIITMAVDHKVPSAKSVLQSDYIANVRKVRGPFTENGDRDIKGILTLVFGESALLTPERIDPKVGWISPPQLIQHPQNGQQFVTGYLNEIREGIVLSTAITIKLDVLERYGTRMKRSVN